MINGKYHEEFKYEGKDIIIDIADLKTKYEVMVMYAKTGNEIEYERTESLDQAVFFFRKYLEKYKPSAKPLSGKYAKLRDDLKIALGAAQKIAYENPEDGGTCNFDASAINLPRWKEKLIEQAAKEAGTSAMTWHLFGSKCFVFSPNTPGQANRRTRAAEAMTKALSDMGYDAFGYYAMD